MLYASAELTGFGSGGLLVPSGAVVAYEGTIASIPADWDLCDGTNSTPNLTNKFIRAAGDTYSLGATGGGGSQSVTVGSSGGHKGASGAIGRNNASLNAIYYGNVNKGSHSHGGSASIDEPINYSLAYIKANTETKLPTGAIVHMATIKALPNHSDYSTLEDRLAKSVATDTRANGGATARAWNVDFTTTAGNHNHRNGRTDTSGDPDYSNGNDGNHTHTNAKTGTDSTLPSYLALKPIILIGDSGVFESTILAYDGTIGSLSADWKQHVAAKDRFIVGSGGTYALNSTGGAETINKSGTSVNKTVNHSHHVNNASAPSVCGTYECFHNSWNWSHNHTYNTNLNAAPPWYALNFIERA